MNHNWSFRLAVVVVAVKVEDYSPQSLQARLVPSLSPWGSQRDAN